MVVIRTILFSFVFLVVSIQSIAQADTLKPIEYYSENTKAKNYHSIAFGLGMIPSEGDVFTSHFQYVSPPFIAKKFNTIISYDGFELTEELLSELNRINIDFTGITSPVIKQYKTYWKLGFSTYFDIDFEEWEFAPRMGFGIGAREGHWIMGADNTVSILKEFLVNELTGKVGYLFRKTALSLHLNMFTTIPYSSATTPLVGNDEELEIFFIPSLRFSFLFGT